MQLDRVCNLASRYGSRQFNSIGPPPPPPHLLQPSLDLDMGMYNPRHFPETMDNCTAMMPMPLMPENSHFQEGVIVLEEEKHLSVELAVSSLDELMKMCQATEPLWIRSKESSKEVLNIEEYVKMFPWPMNNPKSNPSEFRTEATRDSAVVIMNSITLVDAFLDAVSLS